MSVAYLTGMLLCLRMYFPITPTEDSTMNIIQCQDVSISKVMPCFWTVGESVGDKSNRGKTNKPNELNFKKMLGKKLFKYKTNLVHLISALIRVCPSSSYAEKNKAG